MEVPPVLAVNTLAFHGYELSTAFEAIKSLGFTHVEPALISSYYPEFDEAFFSVSEALKMKRLITESDLKVRAMGGHMDLGAAGAVPRFVRRMEFAKELGASIIHTNSTTREKLPAFFRNLVELAEVARSLDLVIALENPGDGQDSVLASGRQGAELIEMLGLPFVRLNYDFSNTYSYSKGAIIPEEDFRAALPFTAHWHLKEMRSVNDEWEFVAIGHGITDYNYIFENTKSENLPPMSIELPLRFYRGADYKITRDPQTDPVSLEKILQVLDSSKKFVEAALSSI
jgi:sugar phosphate isomerase/epimerase